MKISKYKSAILISLLSLILCCNASMAQTKDQNSESLSLSQSQASHFALLALKCLRKEYPNKIEHLINDASQVQSPQALHPAFFGCYDWHSSVHGHWLVVRLLRLYPNLAESREIRAALDKNLTGENLEKEADYFKEAGRQSFERTYGWAWLLKLDEELYGWTDADAKRWHQNLQPLVDVVVAKYIDFLPKQNYPIRTGVHPNTAFGLTFALDYARTVGNKRLEDLITERSLAYFGADKAYPAAWEPGGEDFLSPALIEADLMRRVMKAVAFRQWFHQFLPEVSHGAPASLLKPAVVTDRTDPKLVHLDGLNLSRAWCMRSIASALSGTDPARKVLMDAATLHAQYSLAHVASGDYVGEHWLASFAVYLLSTPVPK
ncbi:MAG: DUF2891 domain-containing protein [Acidobacteria bacterium]|nr:MAG: DUF2891 domain-containing protein [Acidobacteriota bacterium]